MSEKLSEDSFLGCRNVRSQRQRIECLHAFYQEAPSPSGRLAVDLEIAKAPYRSIVYSCKSLTMARKLWKTARLTAIVVSTSIRAGPAAASKNIGSAACNASALLT